jgi:hypothetical protein
MDGLNLPQVLQGINKRGVGTCRSYGLSSAGPATAGLSFPGQAMISLSVADEIQSVDLLSGPPGTHNDDSARSVLKSTAQLVNKYL